MRLTATSATLMVAATALWGGHYVLAGVVVAEMSPFSLTLVRWAVAAIPLLLIAQLVERPDWRTALRAWPRLLLLSALGMLAYNMLLYVALEDTTPIGASLVNAANPALMAILAALLTREMLRPRGVIGIVISFVGVLLVLSGGSLSALTGMSVNSGQLLMVGAILVWSLYSIWGRVPGVPPITSTALQAVVATAVLLPFAPFAGVELPTTSGGWWSLAYIALVPSVASYVLWNTALRSTPAGTAAIFLNLITVSAVVIATIFGATLPVSDLVGGLVIVAGVVVTSWPAAPSRATGVSSAASRRHSAAADKRAATSLSARRAPRSPRLPAPGRRR